MLCPLSKKLDPSAVAARLSKASSPARLDPSPCTARLGTRSRLEAEAVNILTCEASQRLQQLKEAHPHCFHRSRILVQGRYSHRSRHDQQADECNRLQQHSYYSIAAQGQTGEQNPGKTVQRSVH